MRSNQYLNEQLSGLLSGPFSDMPISNQLTIHFGRRARWRFGSIKMRRDQSVSEITINGVFKQERIPEKIILATIAHELCHYAHGFSSPLPRKYKHPHQGGVIRKEMQKRGLGQLFLFEKTWTKTHWRAIVRQEFPQTRRRVRRVTRAPKSPLLKALKKALNMV